jgi:hypothetical protein
MREHMSKSSYAKGLQCPKMLWMSRHMPDRGAESPLSASLMRSGDEVGDLAMGYFGPYREIENDFDFPRMAGETARLVDEQAKAARDGSGPISICEATFVDGEGHLCMADIILPAGDGSVSLVEVKSSTRVKPYHIDDAAYQVWVVERCGYRVSSASIMHVDPSYVREGGLDVSSLFALEDVTGEVRARIPSIEANLAGMLSVADMADEPETAIGRHCNSPHPCPFQGWCWRDVPENSVFDLAGVGRTRGMKWWDAGVRTFEDARGLMGRNGFRDAQIDCSCGGPRELADKAMLRGFLATLSWPICHLDFETFQMAVPLWDGTRPYQQITSQYSLHIQEEPGGPVRHAEFLADEGSDPRRTLAERLCSDVPHGACVTAYNMSFEKGRIRELAAAFPDLGERLLEIHDSIVDLMEPFKKGWLYRREMGGSYSIKSVLPAFFPDDPELDYHALDGVHNGSEAASAFLNLALMGPEERGRTRESLLRYCELDTLAMVKVLEAIEAAAA